MGIINFAKNTGVGIFLAGCIIALITPQPLDIFFFMIQNYIYSHPDISRTAFTLINIFTWYILDAIWYSGLFLLAYWMDIKDVSKVKMITIIATIISLGAVIGIVWRFII
jgi:hypothetical protein